MLLSRNQKQGIDVEVTCIPNKDFDLIPDWLIEEPTPWNLVAFFDKALSRCIKDGSEKSLVNGYKAELRPAKILLDKYGAKRSAELILNKSKKLVNTGNFTLWRVIDYGEEQVAKRRYAKRSKPISTPKEDG